MKTKMNIPSAHIRWEWTIILVPVLIFLSGELILRLMGLGYPPGDNAFPRFYFESHPTMGYLPRAGFSKIHKKYFLKNNSKNMRDAEHSFMTPEKSIRILGIGGSETWGVDIATGMVFLSQASALINEESTNRKIEMLLGGVPGFATDQMAERALDLGEVYKPQMIILTLWVDQESGELPKLLAHEKFGIHRVFNGYFIPPKKFNILEHTSVRRSLNRWWMEIQYRSNFINYLLGNNENQIRNEFYVPLRKAGKNGFMSAIISLTKNLEKIRNFCQSKNIEFILITIPGPNQNDQDNLFSQMENVFLRNYSQDNKILLFNAFEIISITLENKIPLYTAQGHLNEHGHKVVGQELSKFLISNFFLQRPPPS